MSRKILSALLLFAFSATQIFAFPFTLNPADTVSTGMSQGSLTEDKVHSLSQYLFQNRNNSTTSTLVDAQMQNIVELDKNNLYQAAKWKSKQLFSGSGTYALADGKAIYDTNIAIVEAANPQTGRYTYETPYFCDLLISSLAKFSKIGGNTCLSSYSAFASAYTQNPARTYVTVIKSDEIKTANLSAFGVIIFPDIVLGTQSNVLDQIETTGIANIQTYVQNGGQAIFSSKSIVLAAHMWLVSGVNEDMLIKHRFNNGRVSLQSTDFTSRVLNLGLYEGKDYTAKTGSGYFDYVLGSYVIDPTADNAIVPVRYFDPAHDAGYYFQDIPSSEEIDTDTPQILAAFWKPYGKGSVVYNGANSLYSDPDESHILYVNHLTNAILLGFLRDVYATARVAQTSNPSLKSNIVPALEKQITFSYQFHSQNIFSQNVTNLSTQMVIATGTTVDGQLGSDCSTGALNERIITCQKALLGPGENWDINFSIRVNEPSVTQAGNNIAISQSTLTYTNDRDIIVSQPLGSQLVNALESANMRASLNIDPAGYYPLKGDGQYIDQVLDAENKGASEANSVAYNAIVPLISPLFDEYDQKKLVERIKLDTTYYTQLHNSATLTSSYPFLNIGECAITGAIRENRCKDYMIPSMLTDKNVLVDNYDEPVERIKVDETEIAANINPSASINIGGKLVRQTFLPDADSLLMHASPRQMVFTKPTAQKELLFARQDVYFYPNAALPLPKGINNAQEVISIEGDSHCTEASGSYIYPNAITPAEHANALLCGGKVKVGWDNLPAPITQTSYLYPIDPINQITDASQLVGFDSAGNYIGNTNEVGTHSNAYPIKFLRGSYASFYLPARSTLKGGYIELTFEDGKIPQSVSAFADHIAIDKIEQEGNVARIYFYRGKMPNEQSLRSPVGIGIEGVTDIMNVSAKVYTLTYNLGQGDKKTYTQESTLSASFAPYSFLKMPAVKLRFELPRRKRIDGTDVANLNLTDGQKAVLFNTSEYYDTSLIFKATSLPGQVSLCTQAHCSAAQAQALQALYQNTTPESYLRKWELMQPMVRFGTYIQELAFHRTVYGTAEDHPISDPGLMVDAALFGSVGNVGMAPIPFREYLTTGSSQVMPLTSESTRLDYTDIFGRTFAAPIRSTVPEAAPLPPPLRNFQMNTTYEMYDESGASQSTWDGETPLEVRENVKVFNNYAKYFDPTRCANNTADPTHYGICYNGTAATGWSGQTNTLLSAKTLDALDFSWMSSIQLFAKKVDYDLFMSGILAQMTASGITDYIAPTLRKIKSSDIGGSTNLNVQAYNYSPQVDTFYPNQYATNSMWNLTHWDYDDSVYAKGYPYHLDNLIPNAANESALSLPHNLIAIPFSKGVGYKNKYFSEEWSYGNYEAQNTGRIETTGHPYASWKYTGRTGWWPENLQNRDNTLLAGQDSVNTVPYDARQTEYLKTPLISESNFTSIPADQNYNIYACLFNPKTISPNENRMVFAPNVNLNNVIPIFPWIQKDLNSAQYVNNYNCQRTAYSENTLSKINNTVETEDAYWGYFAANLRGEAKEALNTIHRIYPISASAAPYEGDLKVVEGGRFTYWNPGLGLNAYEIVDNPVSIVKSVASSVAVDKELLPYTLKNTNTDAYLLYTVKDPTELSIDTHGRETARKWKDETYTDSRGNGNYSSQIVVGASENLAATRSLIHAGGKTLINLRLANNSGFDWPMTGSGEAVNDNGQFVTHISGGIDFDIVGSAPLNANDLFNGVTRNILKPKAFNFVKFTIPTVLQPYVHLTPSDASILTPGTFFDFDSINATTIRDGFKGDYMVNLTVDDTLPVELAGQVYNIKAELDPAYFTALAGVEWKDSAHWPKIPELPDIRFAIANDSNEAEYISGYSTGIVLNAQFDSGFQFESATQITEEGLNQMRLAAGDGTNKHKRLREVFSTLSSSGYALRTLAGVQEDNGNAKSWKMNFSDNSMPQFPYFQSGSVVAKTYVLVHITKEALSDGQHVVETGSTISYTNAANKAKTSNLGAAISGYAQGPSLDIHYTSSLVDTDTKSSLEIQKLVADNPNMVKLKVYLKNTGTDVAFDPAIQVHVTPGIQVDTNSLQTATLSGDTISIQNLYSESGALSQAGEAIGPGITSYFPIYLTYSWAFDAQGISLVNSANYAFTPFDPILPERTGSYSTGYTLGFLTATAAVLKTGPDNFQLVGSGNTPWILWSVTADGAAKTVSSAANNGVVSSFAFDPTTPHEVQALVGARTREAHQVTLQTITQSVSAETPFIQWTTALHTTSANGAQGQWQTNKLGQYGGWYRVNLDGATLLDHVAVSQNGHQALTLNNLDLLQNHTGAIEVGSGTDIIATLPFTLSAQLPQISQAHALRSASGVLVSFQTNALYNTRYTIDRDGTEVASGSVAGLSSIIWNDVWADVFTDHTYSIAIRKFGNDIVQTNAVYSSNPDTGGIPLKIFNGTGSEDELTFNQVKDYVYPLRINDTLVRYAVRMRSTSPNSPYVQSGSGGVEVQYSTGQIIYAPDGWDKKLMEPYASSGAERSGYTPLREVSVGSSLPLTFEKKNLIFITPVWERPTLIVRTHGLIQDTVAACSDFADLGVLNCFWYSSSTNTVIISTDTFSSYTLYKTTPPAVVVQSAGGGDGGGGGHGRAQYTTLASLQQEKLDSSAILSASGTTTKTSSKRKNPSIIGAFPRDMVASTPKNGEIPSAVAKKLDQKYVLPLHKRAKNKTLLSEIIARLKKQKVYLKDVREKQLMSYIIKQLLDN